MFEVDFLSSSRCFLVSMWLLKCYAKLSFLFLLHIEKNALGKGGVKGLGGLLLFSVPSKFEINAKVQYIFILPCIIWSKLEAWVHSFSKATNEDMMLLCPNFSVQFHNQPFLHFWLLLSENMFLNAVIQISKLHWSFL